MAIISCAADDKYASIINKNYTSNVVQIGSGGQKNKTLLFKKQTNRCCLIRNKLFQT